MKYLIIFILCVVSLGFLYNTIYADFSHNTLLQNEGLREGDHLMLIDYIHIEITNSSQIYTNTLHTLPTYLQDTNFDLVYVLGVNDTMKIRFEGLYRDAVGGTQPDQFDTELFQLRVNETETQFVAVFGDKILFNADKIDWSFCPLFGDMPEVCQHR